MEQPIGAMHSEARKRIQEANGEPEARLLTENHPVYIGEMSPEIYDMVYSEPEPFCKAEVEQLKAVREELKKISGWGQTVSVEAHTQGWGHE